MTDRQRRIVEYIDAYWEENWTSPTVREIMAKVGLSSTSSVQGQLTRMTLMGVLECKRLPGRRVLYRVPKTW